MKEYTNRELEKLYKKALNGDIRAESELREINKRYAKEANRKMANLEMKGRDYYAYDMAYGYTSTTFGGRRFRYDFISLPSVEALYESLKFAKRFNEGKTSTVRGQMAAERKSLETFRRMGINIPKDTKSQKLFLEFLRNEDMLQPLKEVYGSNEIFGLLANALAPRRTRKKRLEDFINAFAKSSDEALKVLRSYGSAYRFDYNEGRYYNEDN